MSEEINKYYEQLINTIPQFQMFVSLNQNLSVDELIDKYGLNSQVKQD